MSGQFTTTGLTRRRVIAVALAALVLVAMAGAAFGLWYLFLRPQGPAAVSETSVPLPSAASTGSVTSGGIEGAWKVDTSIHSSSDSSGSFVGYRVQEELANVGGNVAVGRTSDVSGSLSIKGTSLATAEIQADLMGLKSDDDRRDGRLARQGIETSTYPTATFTLTSPVELGSAAAAGDEITITASGRFTLHGQTRDVHIPLKAKLTGGVIAVTGSLPIRFADYGIEKPNSFAVLSIADEGTWSCSSSSRRRERAQRALATAVA